MREITVSAIYVMTIILLTAHSESRLVLHKLLSLFGTKLTQWTLPGGSRSTARAPYTQSIWVFLWESTWKFYTSQKAVAVNVDLTWQYPLCKSIIHKCLDLPHMD